MSWTGHKARMGMMRRYYTRTFKLETFEGKRPLGGPYV